MIRRVVLHPLLFAAYPVVFLYARNLYEQVSPVSVVEALSVILVATGLLWLLSLLLLKNVRKAAVATSIFVVLFFTFGHIADVYKASESSIARENLLLVAAAGLAVAAVVGVVRTRRDLRSLTILLNVFSATLVLLNLIPITTQQIAHAETQDVVIDEMHIAPHAEIPAEAKRDIYYLIFDRYANAQTLSTVFGFDNNDFLGSLERKGFFVAHDSAANHARTTHSLASSLNLTYLNGLEKTLPRNSGDYEPLYELLRNYEVARFLRSIGYRHYHLGSWWEVTKEDPSADVDLTYGAMSEFSTVLLRSTFVSWLSESHGIGALDPRSRQIRTFRDQVKKLSTIKEDPRPTFTFAHILMPHDPFVFDSHGNTLSEDAVAKRSFEKNYVQQLIYTNKVIERIVSDLLDEPSEEDPIIIIQSDEGPHPSRMQADAERFDWFNATDSELREKFLILNAYYFPDGHDDALWETISPVNSFRVLFNEYFGTSLPLLPDRSFVHRGSFDLYNFRDVTQRVRPQPS